MQRLNFGKADIFEALYDNKIRSSDKFEAFKQQIYLEKEQEYIKNCTF
jgi:hypothetical protein